MLDFVKTIRLLFAAILLVVFSFLIYQSVVPFGRISYVRNFADESRFIDVIKPLERTQPVINGTQTITGGPVYFNLKAPRNFDQAEVTLTYRTSPIWQHQIIEMGVLVDQAHSQFKLEPIENTIIDKQLLDWKSLKKDQLFLYQKQVKYYSIDEFLNNLPNQNELAVYNYNLKRDFRLPGYASNVGGSTFDWPLAGGYNFYTYGRDELLKLTFAFVDQPDDSKIQKTSLVLYEDGNVVKIEDLSEERLLANGQRWSHALEYQIRGEHVYRLELRADKKLETLVIKNTLGKLSFIGRVPFALSAGHDIALLTDSKEVNLLAINSLSLGGVSLGTSSLKMTKAFEQYSLKSNGSISDLKIAKSGLEIIGDGVFAPSEKALINPRVKNLNYLTNIDSEGINYVLASYTSPTVQADWKTAKVKFDLRTAQKEKGDYKFIISVPGFKNGENTTNWLELKEIKVDLTGQALMQKLKNSLRNFIKSRI
ncbi:MAG: hypothetical protein WCG01_04610 [bacterium]